MPANLPHLIRFAVPAIALLMAMPLQAAVIPYTNNFSGTGGNVDFPHENAGSGQSWEVIGGEYRLRGTVTSGGQISTSAVQPITNAGSVAAFTMETKFRLPGSPAIPNGANFVGLAAFGLSSGMEGAGASTAFYLADWRFGANSSTDVGQVRILSLGDTLGFAGTTGTVDDFTGTGGGNWAAQADTVYTLRLTATVTGGTLSMSFGVFDAAGTTQIGTSATGTDTSPLTGEYFGLRSRIGSGGQPQDLLFDDFSIIPEPGSLALAAVAGACLLGRRRGGRAG